MLETEIIDLGLEVPRQFKISGKSNIGLVRTGNEDNLLIDEKNQVFVVCDGMGGHQAGEVASMMACEIINTVFDNFSDELNREINLEIEQSLPKSGDVLIKSIRLANRAIHNRAGNNPSLHGMGTTVVALALEYDLLSIAHVGDSRAYRLEERKLEPLTIDHSWIAEIQQSQNITEEEASSVIGKNVITRALGVKENVEVDYRMIKVQSGDKFILCSDGLCGYAEDSDIFNVVHRVRDNNEKIVDDLIQMANDQGGSDNVTIIVLEILDVSKNDLDKVEKITVKQETSAQSEIEDSWLDKIKEYIAHKDENIETAIASPKKSYLVLIFVLFIITAAAVIYFSTTR